MPIKNFLIITKACLYTPRKPHFDIVKLGFTGVHVYTFFSYFCLKHRLWVRIRTASSTHNLCFWAAIRKIVYIYPVNPRFTVNESNKYPKHMLLDVLIQYSCIISH